MFTDPVCWCHSLPHRELKSSPTLVHPCVTVLHSFLANYQLILLPSLESLPFCLAWFPFGSKLWMITLSLFPPQSIDRSATIDSKLQTYQKDWEVEDYFFTNEFQVLNLVCFSTLKHKQIHFQSLNGLFTFFLQVLLCRHSFFFFFLMFFTI